MSKIPLEEADDRPVGRKPQSEFTKRDPMAEMFGPGSGLKLVGDPDDEMPDEVRAAIDEFGLSKRTFQCVLKEIPAGSSFNGENTSGSQNGRYIKGFVRSVPSLEYIARNYGPGSYILMFSWRTRNDETDGISKSMTTEVPLEISEKYADEYKKHRLNAKISEASEISSKVRDTLIEKKVESSMLRALTGEDHDKKSSAETAKEFISQTIETVKMLGIPLGQPVQPPQRVIEWDKLMPAIITGAAAIMKVLSDSRQAKDDQFNKMLMLLMTQNQSSTQQMMETLKMQSGAGSGNLAIKEFKDMVFGAIDLKEALAGKQETLADKIFKVVEGVAPQILTIAATAASARQAQSNPLVQAAAGYINSNPDFRALQGNPQEMKAFIEKLDSFFGWKQGDMILQVVGWSRPDYCPRDAALENPPQLQDENRAGNGPEPEAVQESE